MHDYIFKCVYSLVLNLEPLVTKLSWKICPWVLLSSDFWFCFFSFSKCPVFQSLFAWLCTFAVWNACCHCFTVPKSYLFYARFRSPYRTCTRCCVHAVREGKRDKGGKGNWDGEGALISLKAKQQVNRRADDIFSIGIGRSRWIHTSRMQGQTNCDCWRSFKTEMRYRLPSGTGGLFMGKKTLLSWTS